MSATPAARRPLIAALTGAGISTDSGIPDYRGPNGLWRREPDAEKLVTYRYYVADEEIRRRAWVMRRDVGAAFAEPNPGHRALVELERAGVPLRVLTQNVDGLHQKAGLPDRKVFELHGTAQQVVCLGCGERGTMAAVLERVAAGEGDPPCRECGAVLKPATVMFGELLDPVVLDKAQAVAAACQVFLAIGSTLQVHPAAGLVDIAVAAGARLIVVNATETPYDHVAEEVIREPISASLPGLVRRILAGEFG
ncbi:Sir2 family NAD-dependent protein deacetylase [Kitasatospora sp. NPDC002227]|uniref:SIR2 family NAD-dependent protein deacylase n=1 Tax=Kitasatospora sp. NPDC002227 TaxID=3154773 RepID=UPI003329633F